MSINLDVGTLFRLSALLFFVMSLMTWLMLGRPRRGAILLWCSGGVLLGVSVWLISLRGQISDLWTYGVAQTSFMASVLISVQSLRMDVQRSWHWPGLVAILFAYAAVITFGFDDKSSQYLAIFVRMANCAGLSMLTTSALTLARHERSRNAWLMTFAFGLMTVVMMLTTLATIRGQANLQSLQNSVISQVLGAVSLMAFLLSYLAFFGLTLERTLRQNMSLRQTQWQAKQWREHSQALALLDRQRTLGALANSLGHAILQPLTATLLQVQLAKRMLQTATPDVQQVQTSLAEVVQGLRRSADWVAHIRNFLRPAPAAEPASTVTMQSVVQDAHDLLRQELMYQGVTLLVTVPPDPMEVQAERLPLTQALVQVLRNAMQAVHKQAQRTIHLTLSGSDTEVWMEVTDTGPGFTLEMLDSEQAIALPASEALYGMGLAMTRNILAQFRGRLTLDNNQHGGARVRMTLPAQAIQGCAKINLTAAS